MKESLQGANSLIPSLNTWIAPGLPRADFLNQVIESLPSKPTQFKFELWVISTWSGFEENLLAMEHDPKGHNSFEHSYRSKSKFIFPVGCHKHAVKLFVSGNRQVTSTGELTARHSKLS